MLDLVGPSFKLLSNSTVGVIAALQVGYGGVLHGVTDLGQLFTVDKATGAFTAGATTISVLQGLSIDGNGRWYATNTTDDSLYWIDMATGVETFVGVNAGVSQAKGFQIVPRPRPNTAFIIEATLNELFEVSLTTGAATFWANTGNNGLGYPAALAWRDDLGEMWTIDFDGEIGVLELISGGFAKKFETGFGSWQGMAWDPLTKRFYLTNQNGSNYVLDPATGVTKPLGSYGTPLLTALEVDVDGGLSGVDVRTGEFGICDKVTGATRVLSTTLPGFQGLAKDDYGRWYGNNTNDNSLYQITLSTGLAIRRGSHGVGINNAKGLEIVTQSIMRDGVGCKDSGGTRLSMLWQGTAELGDQMLLSCNVSQGGSFFLLFGASNQFWAAGSLPFSWGPLAPGCSIYQSTELSIGRYPWGTWVTFTVPLDPAFIGQVLFVQGMQLDPPANPFGLVFSDYIRMVFSS